MSTCKIKKKGFKFNQIIFIIQYRDVQYRVPRCPICSVPRCPDTPRTRVHSQLIVGFMFLKLKLSV